MRHGPSIPNRCLGSLITLVVIASSASAAAAVRPLASGLDETASEPLESGGWGCYDPQAWVWSASRAERVAVTTIPNALCEIGTPGCERTPESLPEAGVEELTLSPAHICALKSAQHSRQSDTDEVFDNKSCLDSARELELVSMPAPMLPFDGPSCHDSDPECVPMPPAPGHTISTPHLVMPAHVGELRWPIRPSQGPDWAPAPDDGPTDGFRRRVERPPTAAPARG